MPVRKYDEIHEVNVRMGEVSSVTKKVPIGKPEGWSDYTLRVFKIKPGGFTPNHNHDWEHANYVISGKGQLSIDYKMHELSAKDFAFVPPRAQHRFKNPYNEDFEFICIVPNRGEY